MDDFWGAKPPRAKGAKGDRAGGPYCWERGLKVFFFGSILLLMFAGVSFARDVNVLFLHSNQPSVWTEEINQGFESVFAESTDIDVFVEYMGAQEDDSPAFLHALRAAYEEKYRRSGISLLVVSGRPALSFALKYKDIIFPDAQIVFCGVTSFSSAMIAGRRDVTGVTHGVQFGATLDALVSLFPDTRKLYVLADRSAASELALKEFVEIARLRHADITIITLRDLAAENLVPLFASLSSDSVAYFISFGRDMLGSIVPRQRLARIFSTSPVPVFAGSEAALSLGVLGGYMASGFEQGRNAARLALRVLSGESPALLSVQEVEGSTFFFNWQQLKRFGVSEGELPEGSRIYGEDNTFVRLSRGAIWTFAAGFVALLILAAALVVVHIARRRSERALMQERDHSANIIERTPAVICGVGPDGETRFINPFAEMVTGYKEEEIIGKNWWETFYPDEAYEQVETLFREMRGVDVSGYEMTLVTRDGGERTIVWTSMNHFDSGGKLVEVIGFGDDVTERRMAEQTLRDKEARYRLLFEAAHDGILILKDGRFVDCNKRCEQLFGANRKYIIGHEPKAFSPKRQLGGILSSAKAEELIRAAEDGTPTVFEWRHRRADESLFDAEVSLSSFAVDGDQYVQAIVRDVTEARRSREFHVQNEKMMSLGGLAAGMAHEINNPLGAILQSVQNIERRLTAGLPGNAAAADRFGVSLEGLEAYLEDRGIDRMLTGIREAGARAADIVRNMLDFSKSGSVEKEQCDLAQCMENAIKMLERDFGDELRSVNIQHEFEKDLSCVMGHSAELKQVFMHLIRNGVQAVLEGPVDGPGPEVHVRIRGEDGFAVVEVEDNGPGIPEGEVRRLFEPFYTTREPGEGTGLGLSLAYFIVTQNHGGEFEAGNVPKGRGARFTVRLPKEDGLACRSERLA